MKPLEQFSQGIKILLCFQKKFDFLGDFKVALFLKYFPVCYKDGENARRNFGLFVRKHSRLVLYAVFHVCQGHSKQNG